MIVRCCFQHSIRQICWLIPFLRALSLMAQSVSLPAFASTTNVKQHHILITLKLVKKVITNLDSLKASGPDCILVEVLKNCKPEFSYISAELVLQIFEGLLRLFENSKEKFATKKYHPVSLPYLVTNSLKNL